LGLARPFEAFEFALELRDAAHHAAPINLELSFARASGADTSGLLRQGDATPSQPGEPVLEEGQLNLSATLFGAGVLGEYVENHRRPVDSRPPEHLLQVALLRRRQLVVEYNRVGIGSFRDAAQFGGLAATDVGGRIRRLAPLDYAPNLVRACCVDEERQFVEGSLDLHQRTRPRHHSDEDDLLAEAALY
jgi:hypothetical protein